MLPSIVWNTLLLLPVGFVFVVPVIAALLSRLGKYPGKLWWVLLSLVFNWFGYFAYYYVCIKSANQRTTNGNGLADDQEA